MSKLTTLVLVLSLAAAACGGKTTNRNAIPPGTQADRFLLDRGNAAVQKKQWMNAREYYRQLVDGYPNSTLRPDAKLGLGETYMGEGGTANLILAANEFQEFLTFFPTSPRADFAQYQLAMTHYRQMRAPERDQTETREAVKAFEAFFERFPNSALTPEVRQKYREARDRLSEASYKIGLTYYRLRWYPGAIDRFREVLRDDPGYTGRDALYFYLGDSLAKGAPTDKARRAEAIAYFERLLMEFSVSEHLEDAKKRLDELKAASTPTTE